MVSGSIGADATWDADTVRVIGDVIIENGVTLSVAPGVRVEFDGYYSLFVRGRVLSVGTPDSAILWTSRNSEAWRPDSTLAGAWGGIRFEGTLATNPPSLFEWSEICYGKGVEDRSKGGAFFLENCSGLLVRDCRIHHNLARYGGMVFCSRAASPVFAGNLITECTALVEGSVAWCLDSWPVFAENTMAKNHVTNPDMYVDTGTIHAHLSKPLVTGNILWGNTCQYFDPLQIRQGKGFYVRWNDIQYGHPGQGNLEADPLFTSAEPAPFALQEASPCINTGAPDTTGLFLPLLDVAGSARIAAGRIDQGAHECALPAAGLEDGDGIPGHELGRAEGAFANVFPVSPNPIGAGSRAGSQVSLRVLLPETARARVTVHDAGGRLITVLADAVMPAGPSLVRWDAGESDAGVYFVRLEAGGRSAESRVVILR